MICCCAGVEFICVGDLHVDVAQRGPAASTRFIALV